MTTARRRRSRDRAERALIAYLQDHGFAAENAGADVSVPLLGNDRRVAVKIIRAAGLLGELYRWLVGRDLLIVRAARREMLVVVPLRLAVEVAAVAEQARSIRTLAERLYALAAPNAPDWLPLDHLIRSISKATARPRRRLTLVDPIKPKEGKHD